MKIGGRYLHPDDGEIVVTSGEPYPCNFWSWTVLATGEEHGGYATEHWLYLGDFLADALKERTCRNRS